jgi:fucose permease
MNNVLRLKISLYLNYFVFAILLNSVGIVILKSMSNYHVDEVQASTLELFKDLSIAIVSFLIASILPKIGYKNAMLTGLAIVIAGCVIMQATNSFTGARLLFAMVGISFALIKVSVYSMIGLVTDSQKEHSALMSSIEGVFMFGIALAYFLFPAFNAPEDANAWLNVYWLLAGLSLVAFGFLYFTNVENDKVVKADNAKPDIAAMFQLMALGSVLAFLVCAFLFVMIEQGVMTWLPTFNKNVLQLPENISIMMASVLAISLGVGRIVAGYLSSKFSWLYMLIAFIVCAMVNVVFVLPKAVGMNPQVITTFSDIPWIAFAFPLVGFFIAPVYPILNSIILSSLPKEKQSIMTGLIIVFSALGGTLGSRIIGYLFKSVGAGNAFYYLLIPMWMIIAGMIVLNKLVQKAKLTI